MTSFAMKPATPAHPPHSPELMAVATRMVWFKPPAATLANDVFFLDYLMVYGTAEDLTVARQRFDDDDFPPGTARSAHPGSSMRAHGPTGTRVLEWGRLRRVRCGSSALTASHPLPPVHPRGCANLAIKSMPSSRGPRGGSAPLRDGEDCPGGDDRRLPDGSRASLQEAPKGGCRRRRERRPRWWLGATSRSPR